jgi:hypothetical protein
MKDYEERLEYHYKYDTGNYATLIMSQGPYSVKVSASVLDRESWDRNQKDKFLELGREKCISLLSKISRPSKP